VLAGVLPLDLEVRRCCLLARSRRDGNGGRESEKRIKEDMVRVWQERWTGSAKGRYLYAYFPVVQYRSLCSGYEIGHVMSMFLTGHGAFMEYLNRFAKSATNECLQCGQVDMASHVVPGRH
jgi:hypothetical protein